MFNAYPRTIREHKRQVPVTVDDGMLYHDRPYGVVPCVQYRRIFPHLPHELFHGFCLPDAGLPFLTQSIQLLCSFLMPLTEFLIRFPKRFLTFVRGGVLFYCRSHLFRNNLRFFHLCGNGGVPIAQVGQRLPDERTVLQDSLGLV